MDLPFLARALHVLGVVVWIGGLWMVTAVILPAVRRGDFGPDRLAAFHAVERRFVWHARAALLVVGASGFAMTAELDVWWRFADPAYWWMHAMVALWTIFLLILFVGEPLVLHRLFPAWVRHDEARAFAWFQRFHILLLVMSCATVLGAVAGAHGWTPP
ncbi:MAG: hypothetical protein ACOY45_02700 [Pseudomonadota bacterium]